MPPLIQLKSHANRLAAGCSLQDLPQLALLVAGLCDHVVSLSDEVAELSRQVCAIQLLLVDLQRELQRTPGPSPPSRPE